jgi:hypothetical protein
MKIDERDERLGAMLDEAVRNLPMRHPSLDTFPEQDKPRRQVGRRLAAAAVALVFVGAAVLAGSQFGSEGSDSDRDPVRSPTTPVGWRNRVVGPSPGFEVGVTYPGQWELEPYRAVVVDSNTQPVFLLRAGIESTLPACGELEVIPGVPTISIGREPLGPHDFVVSIQAYTGGGWKEPRHLPPFEPWPSSPSWSHATLRTHECGTTATTASFFVEDGGRRWVFHAAMGSEVMGSRQGKTILEVLDGLRLPPG